MPASIQQVKTEHETALLKLAGVVSIGIGKNATGEAAIIIGVNTDNAALAAELPDQLDGYPVVVQNIGTIRGQ